MRWLIWVVVGAAMLIGDGMITLADDLELPPNRRVVLAIRVAI